MVDRAPALVVSARLATTGKKDDPLLVAFRPPRHSLLLPLGSREPLTVASAISGIAAEDVTVLLDSGTGTRRRYDPAPYRKNILRLRPEGSVLVYHPDEILRFLWHYRDRHDPLALAHARERVLFPPGVVSMEIPRHRAGGRREEQRRAVAELRSLLVVMGASLGVRPPLPPLRPAPDGFGARRLAGVIDAVAGLYAGMLHRFRAPVAVCRKTEEGTALRLADRAVP